MTSFRCGRTYVPAWESGHTRRARKSRERRETATKNKRDTGEDATSISLNKHDYYSH